MKIKKTIIRISKISRNNTFYVHGFESSFERDYLNKIIRNIYFDFNKIEEIPKKYFYKLEENAFFINLTIYYFSNKGFFKKIKRLSRYFKNIGANKLIIREEESLFLKFNKAVQEKRYPSCKVISGDSLDNYNLGANKPNPFTSVDFEFPKLTKKEEEKNHDLVILLKKAREQIGPFTISSDFRHA